MVDNLVHSFGLQLDNGIPVLEFLNNKNDRELVGLEKFLTEIADVPDVRVTLKEKINVQSLLKIDESDFVLVEKFKMKS